MLKKQSQFATNKNRVNRTFYRDYIALLWFTHLDSHNSCTLFRTNLCTKTIAIFLKKQSSPRTKKHKAIVHFYRDITQKEKPKTPKNTPGSSRRNTTENAFSPRLCENKMQFHEGKQLKNNTCVARTNTTENAFSPRLYKTLCFLRTNSAQLPLLSNWCYTHFSRTHVIWSSKNNPDFSDSFTYKHN